MNILFWNIKGNRGIFDLISTIVSDENIDILLLTEFPYKDAAGFAHNYIPEMVACLKTNVSISFEYNLSTTQRVEVFYNANTAYMDGIKDEEHLSGCKIHSVGGTVDVSLIYFHLPSKVNYDSVEQSEKSMLYRKEIEKYEVTYQPDNLTIVCGDFNMNPFESGMVKANGFHSVMDEKTALSKKRTIDGENYKFFYNPMWGFLGDSGKGDVSGTHYYRSSKHILYFWNLYDQVLVRPEAIRYFDKLSLNILTKKAGVYNLLTSKGLINKTYSDHLPIKFSLNI